MRVRYCRTISREVIRPCCIAVCISRMVDSTTVNGCLLAGVGLCAARRKASVAKIRECVIEVLPLGGMGTEHYHVVEEETTRGAFRAMIRSARGVSRKDAKIRQDAKNYQEPRLGTGCDRINS